ncbi:porin [Aliagarivorans taiwanensis]|uniref:porin n=1 Tax=Aliagarivorans taiwanensis TaxID=561966 RepID=UPI00047A377D|nr:porin [Aliagarivorans taiwanensis]
MKKTILAMAVPAMMAAGTTQAVELYNDGTNAFSVGGRLVLKVEARDQSGKDSTVKLQNQSSRINFGFKRQLNENLQARALMEYAMVSPEKNVDSSFTNRLGFIALDHSDYGSVAFGKQWSTFYNVAGATDVFWVYGGSALGIYSNAGDARGAARADEAIKYDIALGGLNLSAMYQFEGDASKADFYRDGSYSAAASYDLGNGLSFGGAFLETKIADEDNAKQYVLNATYKLDSLTTGLSYGESKNVEDFEKARGYEGFVSYNFASGFQAHAGFNILEERSGDAEHNEYIVGGSYNMSGVIMFAEYANIDMKDTAGAKSRDNKGAVGVRYHF